LGNGASLSCPSEMAVLGESLEITELLKG